MTQDTACAGRSVSLEILQESFSKIAVTFQEKNTHIFWVFFGRWPVHSGKFPCPSAMQKKLEKLRESHYSNGAFVGHGMITRSNNNTNAKYVLNREECESKKKHQSSKSLEQRLR